MPEIVCKKLNHRRLLLRESSAGIGKPLLSRRGCEFMSRLGDSLMALTLDLFR